MLALLPLPRQITWGKGHIAMRALRWRWAKGLSRDVAVVARLGEMKIRPATDGNLPQWTIVAGSADAHRLGVPRWPEGYALSITSDGIAIRGRDARGLFYGLVTLQQMLLQTDLLPHVVIRDWPAVAVRYHHDDVSRKQISRVDDFKRIIRQLAMWKISHYTPYMEDVSHLKSFPDIGEGRGKLMPDEVKQIVEEGRRNNVEVFPTYSLIGHQENLLRLPRYAHLARKVFQPASSFDVRNTALRPFLKRVISDACALFPSKLFHMGFDETQGLGADEFIEHANWCAAELVRHGKTPLMWVDMIYNHFGYAKIRKLHSAIVPVNWQYDAKETVPHQKELGRQGRTVWGLAGYNTWCAFVPDQHAGRANNAAWVRAMMGGKQWADAGLGSSQWGDDGYENSRQLPQNAFASFAEYAWSGEAADAKTFDDRFEKLFYGDSSGTLRQMSHAFPASLSLSPGAIWRLHRARPEELQRRVAAGVLKPAATKRDLARVERVLRELQIAAKPSRNADHLLQYGSGLLRTRSVLQRVAGLGRATVVKGLREARAEYARVWLRHNKPENLEVSLAVFDRAVQQWSRRDSLKHDHARYVPVDLSERFDALELDAGGIPIGPSILNGVPWRFADVGKTHLTLRPGRRLRVGIGELLVHDIHLVATGPRTQDGQPLPALRVRLLRRGREVFVDELLRVRHICDWWAPFGNHMWAGGGYAYVDPTRVRPAVRAADYYGMMEIHGFGLAGSPVADTLELAVIDDMPVQVFAITIERALR